LTRGFIMLHGPPRPQIVSAQVGVSKFQIKLPVKLAVLCKNCKSKLINVV